MFPPRYARTAVRILVDEHVAHEILAIAERMAKSGAQVDVRRYVPGSAMPC